MLSFHPPQETFLGWAEICKRSALWLVAIPPSCVEREATGQLIFCEDVRDQTKAGHLSWLTHRSKGKHIIVCGLLLTHLPTPRDMHLDRAASYPACLGRALPFHVSHIGFSLWRSCHESSTEGFQMHEEVFLKENWPLSYVILCKRSRKSHMCDILKEPWDGWWWTRDTSQAMSPHCCSRAPGVRCQSPQGISQPSLSPSLSPVSGI